jgi:hypothetical protein
VTIKSTKSDGTIVPALRLLLLFQSDQKLRGRLQYVYRVHQRGSLNTRSKLVELVGKILQPPSFVTVARGTREPP